MSGTGEEFVFFVEYRDAFIEKELAHSEELGCGLVLHVDVASFVWGDKVILRVALADFHRRKDEEISVDFEPELCRNVVQRHGHGEGDGVRED